MRSSEWIAFLYFLYLAVVCWLRPLRASHRLLVTSVSLTIAVTIRILVFAAPSFVRDWAPLLYVTVAYSLTGRLFVKPSETLESWLRSWDHRLLGDPTRRFAHWPGWLVGFLEVVYIFCFLLLPGGFRGARRGRTLDAGELLLDDGPRRRSRRVRSAERVSDAATVGARRAAGARRQTVRRLASYMVRHATIGVNTFPSGHVAVSLAAALAVTRSMPLTGAALLVLAASVSLACIVGRYHYVVDVVAGVVLAASVWAVVTLCGI